MPADYKTCPACGRMRVETLAGPVCMNVGCGCPSVPRPRVPRQYQEFGSVQVEWGDFPGGIPAGISFTFTHTAGKDKIEDAEELVSDLQAALRFARQRRVEGY